MNEVREPIDETENVLTRDGIKVAKRGVHVVVKLETGEYSVVLKEKKAGESK